MGLRSTFRALITSERGTALPLALLTLLLFTVLGFSLVTLGMTEASIGWNWKGYSRAFYGAEAGLEAGVVGLRSILATTPAPTSTQLSGITAPTLSTPGLSFTAYSVAPALAGGASFRMPLPAGPFGGLSGIATDYRITSQVTAATGGKANLSQVVRFVQVPLFQFGVFYGAGVDLEIAPGAPMTFNGKIFANSNIYLGPGSSLQINSVMATAGNIYRRLKRDSAVPYGLNPQIADASGISQTLNFDHLYQPSFASTWANPGQWAAAANSLFGGQVKDSAMGVSQIVPPIPALFNNPSNPDVVAHQLIEPAQSGDTPALAAAKLYSQAGLRIVDGVASDQGGNPVTLPAGALTSTSFYDPRESKTMLVWQLDISKLGGAAPSNGVVYVASSGPPAACANPCPAVRLVNGAQLPSQGLTIVSQNPVYVQGDYNTVNKVSAAVLADAITVLSNNWAPNLSDTQGTAPLGNRPASSTTVNAAFATGPSAESVLGAGNGQLENDIRFLEDWSGQTFTYAGSIVDLWHSQQVTAPWQNTGIYYNAPIRTWSYDPLFDTTPPPGTPLGIVILKGPWAQQ